MNFDKFCSSIRSSILFMFYEENFKETFLRTNHKIDIHFQIFDETSFSGNFWKLLSI